MSAQRHIGIGFGKIRTWNDGLGEFSLQLGKRISEIAAHWQEEYSVCIHFHLPEKFHGHFGTEVNYLATRDIQRWVHWQSKNFSVWHSLHQHISFKNPLRTSHGLQTVHDLNFFYLKDSHKHPRYVRKMNRLLERSDAAVTDSLYVKKDIENKIGWNQPVSVIPCGITDLSAHPQQAFKDLAGKKFFLHVSRLAPSKGVDKILSMAAIWPEAHFVFAGMDSPYSRELQARISVEKIRNVSLHLEINNEQKAWLYAHCEAFFFPSAAEGFGLPPLEAMCFGKPVFLSTSTSLPEIGGRLARYWLNFEPSQMKNYVKENLSKFPGPEEISAHARGFTWEKCARSYISMYANLLDIPYGR